MDGYNFKIKNQTVKFDDFIKKYGDGLLIRKELDDFRIDYKPHEITIEKDSCYDLHYMGFSMCFWYTNKFGKICAIDRSRGDYIGLALHLVRNANKFKGFPQNDSAVTSDSVDHDICWGYVGLTGDNITRYYEIAGIRDIIDRNQSLIEFQRIQWAYYKT